MVTVGLISPPDWDDPSPAEYHALRGHRVLQHRLERPGLTWAMSEIADFEPGVTVAAAGLADHGAGVIGIVGTPFGWAGLAVGETPHDRNARISAACGVPVVSAISGILDQLRDVAPTAVGLAVTYYDAEWKREWFAWLQRLGLTVSVALSLADIGLTSGPLAAGDSAYWAPSRDQILANVRAVSGSQPDAIVVTGAGARTLAIADRWDDVTSVPVIASDTALYAALDAVIAAEHTDR